MNAEACTLPDTAARVAFPADEAKLRVLNQWEEFKGVVRGKRHAQILWTMARSTAVDMTQREIFEEAKAVGYPSMTNGSRVSELTEMKAIVATGQRACKITGRLATTYALTGIAVARSSERKALASHLVYVVLCGVTPVRVASHPVTAGPNESVGVFKLDRRLSEKLFDGHSAIPDSMNDFEIDLVTRPMAASSRHSRHEHLIDSQITLAFTGTDGGRP